MAERGSECTDHEMSSAAMTATPQFSHGDGTQKVEPNTGMRTKNSRKKNKSKTLIIKIDKTNLSKVLKTMRGDATMKGPAYSALTQQVLRKRMHMPHSRWPFNLKTWMI